MRVSHDTIDIESGIECRRCHSVKPVTEYYRNNRSSSGYDLSKCIECAKAGVRENRADKVEYYREYDRERGSRQTPEYRDEYRASYPAKYKANNAVSNAVRDGKLLREPCEVCGERRNVHGHHDDYAKPLCVRWLCAAHHRQWHIENGEGLNGL